MVCINAITFRNCIRVEPWHRYVHIVQKALCLLAPTTASAYCAIENLLDVVNVAAMATGMGELWMALLWSLCAQRANGRWSYE